MNCTHHIQCPINFICIAPHKCQYQRKLCVQCINEHRVDIQHIVEINKFREMVIQKIKDYQFDKASELTKQRNNFISVLSQIEGILKKIWKQLTESIQQLYDMFEIQNKSYLNIINENTNLIEQHRTQLDELVLIFKGQKFQDWNAYQNSFLIKLENVKNWWGHEVEDFNERLKKQIKVFFPFNQQEFKQLSMLQPIEQKEDLCEILASIKYIDVQIFRLIIQMLKQEKITDFIRFLTIDENQKYFEKYIYQEKSHVSPFDKNKKLKDGKVSFQLVTKIIKQINEDDFNQNDYSSEIYNETKKALMNKISNEEKILEFLIFLIYLSTLDKKFMQSGENSLNLLIEMKVDLKQLGQKNIQTESMSIIQNLVEQQNQLELDQIYISEVNFLRKQILNYYLIDDSTQYLLKLQGHSEEVRQTCFSSDGTTIASCSDDQTIRLWDVQTGKQKSQIEGNCGQIKSVCFSPNDTILASGSDDQTIRLWDVKTGKQKQIFKGHTDQVRSVCYSPDGNTLASGSADKSIFLWDVNKKKLISKLGGHNGPVNSVCFSPDGNILASSSADKSIVLWEFKIGQQKYKLNGHQKSVFQVCFSPDGMTLASGSADKSIILWDVRTGKEKSILIGHCDVVRSVCFSPDGLALASGSYDQVIYIWDAKTGKCKSIFRQHYREVLTVCFSPDSTILASCSGDKFIHLWNALYPQDQSSFYLF
ncbi:unnamed protein product [Paramecium pentaurelia]|uniref:EML-like second beta-propeller domain-containing protein n=1 Tax=Paramecium pentaurelia TaxID=43138 RepID=A0A8S1XBP0_9CILI|nr:unnamed protein product [Paramecium pentaurelia]